MTAKAPTAIICLSPYHGGMEMDAIRTARLLKDATDVTVVLKRNSPSDQHYRKELEQEGNALPARNVRTIIPFGKLSRLKIIYSSLREPITVHSPLTRKDSKPVEILHVGRITGGKGHIDAIRACSVLDKRGIPFRLRFVGEIDISFRTELEDVLSDISYKDRIECTGHIQDPSTAYRGAHVFLFPSKGEGLSNAFMEALAHGLVCIAYKNTSFPELRDLGFTYHRFS